MARSDDGYRQFVRRDLRANRWQGAREKDISTNDFDTKISMSAIAMAHHRVDAAVSQSIACCCSRQTGFISLSTMASIAERRATRRAAASQAEGKIKKTLEEMSGWSASSDGSSDVCRLSDFADLPGDSRKKARKENSEEETKMVESEASSKEDASVKSEAKEASSKSNEASSKASASSKDSAKSEGLASTESNEHKDTESTTTSPSPSPPSPSYSSSSATLDTSPEPDTEERARQYRQQRADARNQHSTGPMLLSRRLSWKLAKAEPSPNFSPITAKSLAFTPSTTTAESDRTH